MGEWLPLVFTIGLQELIARRCHYLESKAVFDVGLARNWLLRRSGNTSVVEFEDAKLGLLRVTLRRGTSDFAVFKQCLIEGQYEPVARLAQTCLPGGRVQAIVDAGGNIGLAAIYFGRSFRGARVLCLEPDPGNAGLCLQNVTTNDLSEVSVLRQALWGADEPVFLNRGFRDGREWSVSVGPPSSHGQDAVDGVSPLSLLTRHRIDEVDILKVDIEGAESEVFREVRQVDQWLPRVRVIALELHDRNAFDLVVPQLQRHGFSPLAHGELVIGARRDICPDPHDLIRVMAPQL